MSKHSTSALTMRDALYEAPGPKMRAKIRIGTAISLVAVAALVVLVLQRFYVTGQLSVHYWYFFTHLTTWKFLLAGFEGTVKVALTAGAIALVLGLALMLGRTSDIKPLQLVCRVLTDFFRGVPSLLFIYFFFLVLPQYKIALPSFWMLTLPVALAAAGVLAEIFRAGVNAVPRGQVEAAQALGLSKAKITFKIVLPQAIRFIIPSLISQLVVVVKDTTVAYVVSYPDLMQNAACSLPTTTPSCRSTWLSRSSTSSSTSRLTRPLSTFRTRPARPSSANALPFRVIRSRAPWHRAPLPPAISR